MNAASIIADQSVLINLLLKLALMAGLASLLVQFDFFKLQLFALDSSPAKRWTLALALGIGALCCTLCRLGWGYSAVEIGLEASVIGGVAGGLLVGLAVALWAGLPALLAGEPLSLLLYLLAGLGAGLLVRLLAARGERFDFSPFSLFKLRGLLRDSRRAGGLSFKLALLLFLLLLEGARMTIFASTAGQYIFALHGQHWLTDMLVLMTVVGAVGIPLKIWNNTRIELQLHEHSRRLLEAKLSALQSKLRPHFLFNTLNTVSSLIRTNPDKARETLLSLSRILRTFLESAEDQRTLAKELELVRAYLAIEQARFGENYLRSHFDIPGQLDDLQVPSMVLQPIVENSVKHGITPKVGGGRIDISAAAADGKLVLRVVDDGVGVEAARLAQVRQAGVGISNLIERLNVLYGKEGFLFNMESDVSRGTSTTIGIPLTGRIA